MKKENKNLLIISLVIIGIVLIGIIKASLEVEHSTSETFDLHVDAGFNKEAVLNEGYPTMLDIGGADCIPCKAMAPVLEKLNEDLEGKAIIKFVDYWKYPALANQFEFSVIPTQFFYDADGNLFTTHEGEITEEEALDIFKEMGYEF